MSVQAGDLDRARRLAADTEALARTITDPDGQAGALTAVARVIGQAGDLDRAEALVRTITDSLLQDWAFTELAIAAAQAADLDRAEALAHTMRSHRPGLGRSRRWP